MPQSLSEATTLHNGVKMPWLGLGTFKVPSGEQVEQAVRWALELGYRHIDTAAFYGNEKGIGSAINNSSVPRQEIFLTTKVWNDDVRAGHDAVLRAFDNSLAELGLDYVDLYLVHWPVPGKYKEAWQALEKILATGQAKAIGVSNFLVHHLRDLMADAEAAPTVNQIEFHPWLRQQDLLDFCRQHRIQVEAWAPLMQGRVFDIPVLKEIAAKYNRTIAQVVLRWELQHGVVVIPKSIHRERIEENARIFDFELSEEDMAKIDALDQNKRLGADPDSFAF